MSNRKDFLEWMKRKKDISFFESRKCLWQLDALNNVSNLFSISCADELPESKSPELKLYEEYLREKFPKLKTIEVDNSANGSEHDELPGEVNSDNTTTGEDKIIDEPANIDGNSCTIIEYQNTPETKYDESNCASEETADALKQVETLEKIEKDSHNRESTDSSCIVEENISEKEQNSEIEERNIILEDSTTNQEPALSQETPSRITSHHYKSEGINYEHFKDYLATDSEKKALDGDYFKKKKAYRRLKKYSFNLLTETYENAFKSIKVHSDRSSSIDEESALAYLVFDVVSGQYANLSDGSINEMASYATYFSEQKEKKFVRNGHAFYYSNDVPRQESTATAFQSKKPSLDVIQRSIRDTISKQKSVDVGSKMICLVPDNLGDFRDTIKSQIRSSGANVIQIPRSIATVYSFAQQYKLEQDTSFVCYDYNSTDLCRTEIIVHNNEETGQQEFTRMRRQRMRGGSMFDFTKIANSYLEAYEEKYHVAIPPKAVKTLVDTRDILKVIKRGQSIPLKVGDEFVTINYDRELVDGIASAIMDEISNDDFEADYCCALLDINTSINGFCTLEYLLDGCREIQKRIKNHEDIWIEYLPELSLEVIRDGTFDNLKLIDKGMIQRISESTMEEEVEIPLKDGRFSLPIGKGKVFCPLVREEYGNKQRDKMAMFDDDQIDVLSKAVGNGASSVQVDLTLTYHYGDPDSYKLTATPCCFSEIQIQSQWCDEEDQVMDNNLYPEYGSPVIKYRADTDDVNRAIQETLRRFSNSHNYTMTGGYQGKPPFNEYGHWLALREMSRIRLSLPHIFSPENIAICDSYTISNAEVFLDAAIKIYRDCENDTLDSGNVYFPCDLDRPSLDNIKSGILDIMSLMGGICVTSGVFEQLLIDDMVDCILSSDNLQYILALSTYIPRNDDYYGVWNKIDELFEESSGEKLRHAIRSLSAVCWRQPSWIYQIGSCADRVLQSIIDTIIAVCKSEADKVYSGYNPRKVRDMLEAFLGISRLKETNPKVMELLDCNNKNIKAFVVLLKELNETMRKAEDNLKYPFVSRLDMEVPDELHNISSVLYPIIEILTGGNAIKLTGFTED